MHISFYGVMGGHTVFGAPHQVIGGNTPCVHVAIPDKSLNLIFDAGSGIINLGQALVQFVKNESARKTPLHLFFSHTHLDHLQGFPFFSPLTDPEQEIHLYGPRHLEETLKHHLFSKTLFPVPLEDMPAPLHFHMIEPQKEIKIQGSVTIKAIALNHPGGCFGYKVTHHNKSMCYLTDHEQQDLAEETRKNLIDFCQDTDLLITDSMFQHQDLPQHKGWGHSSVTESIALAKRSGAKQLALFHHNTHYNDATLLAMEKEAQTHFKNTVLAREISLNAVHKISL